MVIKQQRRDAVDPHASMFWSSVCFTHEFLPAPGRPMADDGHLRGRKDGCFGEPVQF